jgi:hypothetical protein
MDEREIEYQLSYVSNCQRQSFGLNPKWGPLPKKSLTGAIWMIWQLWFRCSADIDHGLTFHFLPPIPLAES